MAGMTNYWRNKVGDHAIRGVAWTPPAIVYIQLSGTLVPTAAIAATALAGLARIPVDSSTDAWLSTQGDTAVSNGSTGIIANADAVDFGTAVIDAGIATHFEVFDALTGGNRLWYGLITNNAGVATPRSIVSGDPVVFPAGSLQALWA